MAVSKQYLAFFLLLFVHSAVAGPENSWSAGFDVSVLSDDNLTRASEPDIEKDTITRVNVHGRYSFNFSLNQSLIFTARFLNERYRDFDGVSNSQAGLEAEYRFRTRTGFTAPVYSLFASSTRADYKTDIRDGSVLEYGLRIRRQLTDRVAVGGGAEYSERTADGQVFDLEQSRYFVRLDYRISGRFQAYVSYHAVDGDTYSISSISPAEAAVDGYRFEAVEWDPAFSGIQRRWAYRVDARTNIARLGLTIAIDRNNAFDISVDDIGSEGLGSGYDFIGGANALTYDATVVAAGYFHRF